MEFIILSQYFDGDGSPSINIRGFYVSKCMPLENTVKHLRWSTLVNLWFAVLSFCHLPLPLLVALAARLILALTFCTACIPNGIDAMIHRTTIEERKKKHEIFGENIFMSKMAENNYLKK